MDSQALELANTTLATALDSLLTAGSSFTPLLIVEKNGQREQRSLTTIKRGEDASAHARRIASAETDADLAAFAVTGDIFYEDYRFDGILVEAWNFRTSRGARLGIRYELKGALRKKASLIGSTLMLGQDGWYDPEEPEPVAEPATAEAPAMPSVAPPLPAAFQPSLYAPPAAPPPAAAPAVPSPAVPLPAVPAPSPLTQFAPPEPLDVVALAPAELPPPVVGPPAAALPPVLPPVAELPPVVPPAAVVPSATLPPVPLPPVMVPPVTVPPPLPPVVEPPVASPPVVSVPVVDAPIAPPPPVIIERPPVPEYTPVPIERTETPLGNRAIFTGVMELASKGGRSFPAFAIVQKGGTWEQVTMTDANLGDTVASVRAYARTRTDAEFIAFVIDGFVTVDGAEVTAVIVEIWDYDTKVSLSVAQRYIRTGNPPAPRISGRPLMRTASGWVGVPSSMTLGGQVQFGYRDPDSA